VGKIRETNYFVTTSARRGEEFCAQARLRQECPATLGSIDFASPHAVTGLPVD
jgi:hypothetical protein